MTTLRLSRTHFPVTALGPGRRIGLWTQGCTISCRGCGSRDTWSATAGGEIDVQDVLIQCAMLAADDVAGVTITGGEPSEQPEALAELVVGLDVFRQELGWDVLCYTGVELDEFVARCPSVPGLLDALITGPYQVDRPTDLLWRGSANQQLVPLGTRGHERFARWVAAGTDRPIVQVAMRGDELLLIGVPRPGDLSRLRRRLREFGIRLEDESWRP